MSTSLNQEETLRYARQLSLHTFGPSGQDALKKARILCIGMGGLGSPLSVYLTAMGLGTMGIVDGDRVDISNLHRQILYQEQDVGQLKVDAAKQRLKAINHHVNIHPYSQMLDLKLALESFDDYDMIIDGTDNFEAKYLINDVCCQKQIPFLYTSVYQFEGQMALFSPSPRTPCLRCLYPNPPAAGLVANCADNGILGVVPGVFALLQALEIIKWLTGLGTSLFNTLLSTDLLNLDFNRFDIRQCRECPACAGQKNVFELSRPSRQPKCVDVDSEDVIEIQLLRQWMASDKILILDVREVWECQTQVLEGSLNIPMNEVAQNLDGLPRNNPIVVVCQKGIRSYKIMKYLKQEGFQNVKSLQGGLNRLENK